MTTGRRGGTMGRVKDNKNIIDEILNADNDAVSVVLALIVVALVVYLAL